VIALTREEAQQVLDALEAEHRWLESLNTGKTMRAIETLCARLAQPEPEPVADKYLMEVECTKCGAKQDGILTVNVPPQRNEPEPIAYKVNDATVYIKPPIYNAPPQREWQGLTDEEMFDCLAQTDGEAKRLPLGFKWFAEAIEAKLKEKNI
jgi:hypothetical protein